MKSKWLMSFPTIEYHDSVSSTNDRIKEMLKQPVLCKLPCLVVAAKQTAGRGRGSKNWWSGEGALMMSLGYELDSLSLARNDLALLAILVGLTVVETVQARIPGTNSVGIHWPNDVYVNDKKICGILIESPTPRYAVIGIGINVNNRLSEAPDEFRARQTITTLIDILGRKTVLSAVTVEFLLRFQDRLRNLVDDPASVVRNAEACCVQIGKDLIVRQGDEVFQGKCIGIAQDGSLRLETPDGIQSIRSGSTEIMNRNSRSGRKPAR